MPAESASISMELGQLKVVVVAGVVVVICRCQQGSPDRKDIILFQRGPQM